MRINAQPTSLILAAVLLSVFFMAACLCAYGQVSSDRRLDDDLLKRRVTLHVKEGMLLEALNRLASEESIPIGWEVSQSDSARHDINIDLKKTPLKDVLDRLVLADPSYQWKLEDGVINIYPAFDRDERLQEFLKVSIKEFSAPKGLKVFEFRDAILALPEVVNFLQSNGLEASHTANCCPGPLATLDFEFRTTNTDLRTLLNRLIRDRHLETWTLTRTGENHQLLHLAL